MGEDARPTAGPGALRTVYRLATCGQQRIRAGQRPTHPAGGQNQNSQHRVGHARIEKALLRLQSQLAKIPLLIVDKLGYVPFSKTGAELLFEMLSQCYERGSVILTSNLPFEEWTGVLGSERLTGALLDRLTHRVHILMIEGDSYRLAQSKRRRSRTPAQEHPA